MSKLTDIRGVVGADLGLTGLRQRLAAQSMLIVSALFGSILAIASGYQTTSEAWGLVRAGRDERASSRLPRASSRPLRIEVREKTDDFVVHLPEPDSTDALARYVARLAVDEGLSPEQLQVERSSMAEGSLGSKKLTLHLTGDYTHIKNLTVGVLSRFNGLVLERMTMRHRDAPRLGGLIDPPHPDEATLEFVQFTRPEDAGALDAS